MNKIMKMATMLAGVGAMLNFAGCRAKAPDQVALDVLKTLQEGKADQAFLEKNCTKETAGMFAMFGGMMKEATEGASWSASQTYIDDDIATVRIKQVGGNKPGEETYYLKKIDGQWKLHVDKEHPGQDMISKKTALELIQTLKNDVWISFNEQELSKRATPEFVTEMRDKCGRAVRSKMTEEQKKKMEELLGELKNMTVVVKDSRIDKKDCERGTIEYETSFKELEELKIEVKRVNGIWKLSEIELH